MFRKESGYIRDESIDFVMKNYKTYSKGSVNYRIDGTLHEITYDVKRDFRDYGKIFVTNELIREATSMSQVSFILVLHIIQRLQKDDNRVFLTASIFTAETGISSASFYRALRQLEDLKWIYRIGVKKYNVNINKFFKGSLDNLLIKYQVQEAIESIEDIEDRILTRKQKLLEEEAEKKINDNQATTTGQVS